MDTLSPETWAEPTATDSVGRTYTWLAMLGRGGFGEVYLARMETPTGLEQVVAVKLLPEGLAADSASVAQLRKEARLLASLRHPVVLAPVDLAEFDTRVALVTEFIDGEDLADCIVPGAEHRLPVSTLLEVVDQVASALEVAWRDLHVVHRDVKPQNIRIGRHGNVKLLDFGLALSDAPDRSTYTAADAVRGTLRYLAPERFDPKSQLTAASDIYSLGCVLYEGIAGEPLVGGDTALPKGFGVSVSAEDWATFVDGRLALVERTNIGALLWSMLALAPRDRPPAREVRTRCEQLASIDPARVRLSAWCNERTWPDEVRSIQASDSVSPPITPRGTQRATLHRLGRGPHLDTDRLASPDPTPDEEAHLAVCVSCRSTRRLLVSELRIGPYQLLGQIGRGGMGVVYAGLHTETQERRALKVLRLAGTGLEKRIRREASLQGKVTNPHVLPLLDVLEHRGSPVLVLPLVEGPTLARVLEVRRLPLEVAAAWFAAMVDGVAALHLAGLIHRDVKPGNVLLDPSSGVVVPKIADFGLAKWLLDEDASALTRSGMRIGTLAYTAPEQLMSAKSAGPTADVWSLGCVALELVTGNLRRNPEGPLPEPWGDIVDRALQQDPRKRPANASELAALLPPVGPVDEAWVALCRSLAPSEERADPGTAEVAVETPLDLSGPFFRSEPPTSMPPQRRSAGWLPWVAAGGAIAALMGVVVFTAERVAPGSPPAAGALGQVRPQSIPDAPVSGEGEVAPTPKVVTTTHALQPAVVVPAAPPAPPVDVWVRTRPWGRVTVDGGREYDTNKKIALTPGHHELALVSHDGANETVQGIDVVADGPNSFCWTFAEAKRCSSP